MRKRKIRERSIEKVEEMLREVKNRVKMRNRLKRWFWTARGIRQGKLSTIQYGNFLEEERRGNE